MIHLVRHADAGSRKRWNGEDRIRPLSDKGHRQAKEIAANLVELSVSRLLSSPYVRCIQTLRPVAEATQLPLDEHPALTEGAGPDAVAALLWDLPSASVLCSHGDVLGDLVGLLAAEGAPLDPGLGFAKGGMWTIRREGRRIVEARYRGALSV